jgi:hypothetical protein
MYTTLSQVTLWQQTGAVTVLGHNVCSNSYQLKNQLVLYAEVKEEKDYMADGFRPYVLKFRL